MKKITQENINSAITVVILAMPLMATFFIPQIKIIALIIGLIVTTGFVTNETPATKLLAFVNGSLMMYTYFNEKFLVYNLILGMILIFMSILILFMGDKKTPKADDKIMYIDDGDTLKTITALGTIRRAHKDPEILFIFDNIVTLEVSCKNKICSLNLTDSAQSTDIGSLNETVFRVKNFILACLENYKLIDEHDLISKLGDKQ